MLAHLSAWWLHLGGVGFFSMVHMFAALGLIVALTVADWLWTVQPPRKLSAPAAEPPTPKGRTRAHWPVSSFLHAVVGMQH